MLPVRPLPKPLLTTPGPLASRLWLYSIGWLASVVVFTWRIWGVPLEGFGLAWIALGVAFHVWILRSIVGLARWKGSRITFGPESFRVYSEGRLLHEVPYRAVAGYRFETDTTRGWLRISRIDGQPEVEVGHAGFINSPIVDQEKIVAALGPRIPEEALQDRRPRPETPLARHLWDHYGHPPPIPLEPGHLYGYIGPDELKNGFGISPFLFMGVVGLHVAIRFIIEDILGPESQFGKHLGGVISLVLAIGAVWGLSFALKQPSGEDAIEVTPEGIEVNRKGRVKRYAGLPTPKLIRLGFSSHKVPALVYGRGFRRYYVFPTLLQKIK